MLGERSRRSAVNLLVPNIGVAEKVLRSAVVYAFLLVAFLTEDGHVSVVSRRPTVE